MNYVHIWQNYRMDPETLRRHAVAGMSWELLLGHGVKRAAFAPEDFARSAQDVGDIRRIPYVNDAFAFGAGLADRVIFTNTDVGFLRDPFDWIASNLDRFGCCYAHRRDFVSLFAPPVDETEGSAYGGADLFAFTRGWLDLQEWPDMLLGYEGWDFVVKRSMNASGFPIEPQYLLYHEEHRPRWKQVMLTSHGQLHNRRVCAAWAKAHGHADEILDEEGGFLFR